MRTRSGGWLVGALTIALLATACGSEHAPSGTSAASCVGPYLSNQPPTGPFRGPPLTVAPGSKLTIYGYWYTTTCNDTGQHDPLEPLPPAHLTLTLPDGAVKHLGQFTPTGQDMGFSATVQVPLGTPAGFAKVSDDRKYRPASYKFHIGK